MPKIMHGSVSQPSVQQLAAEYVIRIKHFELDPDTKMFSSHETWSLRQEIYRRCGFEHGDQHIKDAEAAYDLLTGD